MRNNKVFRMIIGALKNKTKRSIAVEQIKSKNNPKILLCDNYHINKKNFNSLFVALKGDSFSFRVALDSGSKDEALALDPSLFEKNQLHQKYISHVKGLTKQQLLMLSHRNVNVFDIARDEALSRVLATDHWHAEEIPKDRADVFHHFWKVDRQVLHLYCALSMYWLDFWADFPGILTYKHCFVFSGSSIYSKSLLNYLKYSGVKCYVLESFMTGEDYFLEERHSPISNASQIQFTTVYSATKRKPEDYFSDANLRDQIRVFNKLNDMRNKNVKQPAVQAIPAHLKDKKITLILTQVVNDYSIISGDGIILQTVYLYKMLIEKILKDTDSHIIVKCHPWEKKKLAGGGFTALALSKWAESLSKDKRSRITIFDEFNIRQLIEISKHVVTICSQSAIEAALLGKKPITIGGAFYDVGGITNKCLDVNEAVHQLRCHDGLLNISEFEEFRLFLVTLIQLHLLNTSNGDARKIAAMLAHKGKQAHNTQQFKELSVAPTWAVEKL